MNGDSHGDPDQFEACGTASNGIPGISSPTRAQSIRITVGILMKRGRCQTQRDRSREIASFRRRCPSAPFGIQFHMIILVCLDAGQGTGNLFLQAVWKSQFAEGDSQLSVMLETTGRLYFGYQSLQAAALGKNQVVAIKERL